MPFNGPERELRGYGATEFSGEKVYCTQCGTIYVWERGRDCPACTLAELIESVGNRVEALAREQHREADDAEES